MPVDQYLLQNLVDDGHLNMRNEVHRFVRIHELN